MIPRSLRVSTRYLVVSCAVSVIITFAVVWRTINQQKQAINLSTYHRKDSFLLPTYNSVNGLLSSTAAQNSRLNYAKPKNSNTSISSQPSQSQQPGLPHHSVHQSVSHTHRNRSYVLALGYTEQLSAATHTMFNLGTLAADWGASMVEPFVKKSFIFGLQNVVPPEFMAVNDKNTLGLFDIYNQTQVNRQLGEKLWPRLTMSDFDTFLTEASPQVTLFHFTTRSSSSRSFALDREDTKRLENELAKGPTDNVLQCLSKELLGLKRIAQDIDRELNSKQVKLFKRTRQHTPNSVRKKFRIAGVWCLDSHKAYRSDTLRKYVPPHSTVIFTNWRGCGLRKCYYSDGDMNTQVAWRDKFRYGVVTKNRTMLRLCDQYILHHSSIEYNARFYLKKLGYTGPFVAIHARIERLVKQSKGTNDPSSYIEQCLKELTMTVQNLTQTQTGSLKTLLVTDVGSKYGTSTCQNGKNCNAGETKRVLTKLSRLGFHPQSFDPHIINSTENNGYVSLAEMHMLAGGDKLVTVGFGGFQAILENLFLSHGHSKQDVVNVCHFH